MGVLAQENIVGDPHAQGSCYIAASYVKYLGSAGARVVPIRINRTDEEYEKIFNSINGPTMRLITSPYVARARPSNR
ncbi:gamma-glutamyl hydrolase-like isoform X2 [Salvelinus alpinus]|uniref:gamma-glutamyl hydrolase-like isoform X2 n=1 Tax=Salvelinus alpinus TaxID=8036 RepID=UPI0039FC086C